MGNDEFHSQTEHDVAVSIVVYNNSAEELMVVLRSVSDSVLRVHTTVVDNSPTDRLRMIAAEFAADYIHLDKNVGFGSAHNVAIRRTLSKARYHAVVNPDISFKTDVLSELFRFMEENPEIGQAMPSIRNPDGSEQRLAKRLPTPFDLILRRFLGRAGKLLAPRQWDAYETRDLDLSVPREIPSLSGCFMFLRSGMLQQAGLFDERFFLYLEDVDLCRRIGSVGKTVIYPGVCVVHRYEKGSYKKFRLLKLHLASAIVYFMKWGWFHDEIRDERNQNCGGIIHRKQSHDFPYEESYNVNKGYGGLLK